MHNKHRLFVTAALLAVFSAREASGEIYHVKSPSVLVTDKGSKLSLPPGYFLDEKAWQDRDLRMRRLEEQETRLTAENKSLKQSHGDYPWVTTGVVGAFGVAFGVFVMMSVTK